MLFFRLQKIVKLMIKYGLGAQTWIPPKSLESCHEHVRNPNSNHNMFCGQIHKSTNCEIVKLMIGTLAALKHEFFLEVSNLVMSMLETLVLIIICFVDNFINP